MNISTKQRQILSILKQGGVVVQMPRAKRNLRLLDSNRNPLKYLHRRTFNALLAKQLIYKSSNGVYSAIAAKK